MKFRFLVLILCLGLGTPALAQKLTNADVVKMVEGRVPPPIIVQAIQTTAVDFNLGPDALVELKKRGVPDAVLEAMMKKSLSSMPSPAPAPTTSTAEPTGEWASRERGVYLEFSAGEVKQLVKLPEAKITGMNMGGGIGSVLTYGAKKMTAKYRIRDGAAEKRAPANGFALYIAKLNPRDLVLLRVSKKGKEREFEGGKVGGLSGGVEAAKGDFEFTSEEVAPGVYRVVLAKPLQPGEYGFGVLGMGSISPLYDFGIDR